VSERQLPPVAAIAGCSFALVGSTEAIVLMPSAQPLCRIFYLF
jgi:hypothetical protein